MTPLDEIALSWIRMQNDQENLFEYHPDFWSVEAFALIIEDRPSLFFELVDLIFQMDSSDPLVANLGAGPLEDLLVYHGDSFINTIVQKIQADKNWKRAAQNVWKNSMSDGVWQQLQNALK